MYIHCILAFQRTSKNEVNKIFGYNRGSRIILDREYIFVAPHMLDHFLMILDEHIHPLAIPIANEKVVRSKEI